MAITLALDRWPSSWLSSMYLTAGIGTQAARLSPTQSSASKIRQCPKDRNMSLLSPAESAIPAELERLLGRRSRPYGQRDISSISLVQNTS